ncbi:MAG TPA: orotate phosphoribosyltransferase [Firmicutes bacterium]|nr:orotate phosphoribosyltransferase [Bacillota bacterium]
MLEEKEILEIFRETKVLREGHFRLTSGKHSRKYMQCAQVLQYPKFTERLCEDLARRFKGQEIHAVVAPAIGGIIVAYEVAKALGVRALFTEREDGKMTFRRGFDLEEDENVLVVEDVITTGGSVFEVIDAVKERGANVCGVGVLVDRSAGKVHFGVKKESLISIEIETWEPEECPLCKEGIPIVKPGSRK